MRTRLGLPHVDTLCYRAEGCATNDVEPRHVSCFRMRLPGGERWWLRPDALPVAELVYAVGSNGLAVDQT
jgi:hypothetical protein